MDSNLKKMYTVNTFTFEIDVAAAISQFGLNGLWMSPVGWPFYVGNAWGGQGGWTVHQRGAKLARG